MKQNKLWLLAVSFIGLLFTVGCNKENLNAPKVTNTTPPGVITAITVINESGKAQINYTLPKDKDLLYVKATYETGAGKTREVKASYYTSTLTVDGFGDTLSHSVKLYAVNSSEIASAPVVVTVTPQTPACVTALRSLKVLISFGGFKIVCPNPTAENLAIILLVDTAGNGKYVHLNGLENIYSNSLSIESTIRGQPAIKRNYAFMVRDRWLNQSDTMILPLKPLFEQLLDKSIWSNYVLPNDAQNLFNWSGTAIQNVYDGNFNGGWGNALFTNTNVQTPQTVTFDLGRAYNFSRLQLNPMIEGWNYYTKGSIKDFEIWGSNAPNVDGSYDASWTLLTTGHVVKPSGLAIGVETAADYAAGYAGWGFDFPAGLAAYRYVRIKNLLNWSGAYFMSLSEFTLWGQ